MSYGTHDKEGSFISIDRAKNELERLLRIRFPGNDLFETLDGVYLLEIDCSTAVKGTDQVEDSVESPWLSIAAANIGAEVVHISTSPPEQISVYTPRHLQFSHLQRDALEFLSPGYEYYHALREVMGKIPLACFDIISVRGVCETDLIGGDSEFPRLIARIQRICEILLKEGGVLSIEDRVWTRVTTQSSGVTIQMHSQ